MKYLVALNAAIDRFANKFSNKQIFFFSIAVLVANYLLRLAIPTYGSRIIDVVGGGLFGMSIGRRPPSK